MLGIVENKNPQDHYRKVLEHIKIAKVKRLHTMVKNVSLLKRGMFTPNVDPLLDFRKLVPRFKDFYSNYDPRTNGLEYNFVFTVQVGKYVQTVK